MNHAMKVDPVQAMRVRLAVRWGLAPDDIGYWRAELELKRQRARIRVLAASNGNQEEVLTWQ
jgi:hypothetical protein